MSLQGKPVKISRNIFILFLSLYFVCLLNIPFWGENFKIVKFNRVSDLIYLASMFIGLSGAFTIVFNLVLFKHFEKFLALVFALIAIFASYHMYYFKVMIDLNMIQNVLQTDIHEASDLISMKFGIWLFLLSAPLLALCFIKIRYESGILKEVKSRLISIILSILLIAFSVGVAYKNIVVIHRNNRNLTKLINPLSCIFYLGKFVKLQVQPAPAFKQIGLDAAKGARWQNVTKKSVVVIVVGEAARAGNFSLNGYARETNPLLKTRNVISLKDVSSCGTCTAVSVPGMFSRLPRNHYTPEKAAHEENLLDVLARAGFSVLWHDNNSSSKGVATRVKEDNIRHLNQNDEALLDGLEKYLNTLQTDGVIVLHQLGSHGPAYYKRYPERFNQFKPGCNTNEIQSCKKSDLVNSYDNTILYTDYVLVKIIDLLAKNDQLNTAMIYVSDHGESLGEYGLYLHGTPYLIAPKEQTHIPWIMWFSDSFAQEFGINFNSLKTKADTRKYSHDNLFHSVLGLLDISTNEYDQGLDIFKN
jgi:lipid A ethanolaminephosphotransferase